MSDEIITENADSDENTAITEEVAPVSEEVSETKPVSSNMSAEDFISSRLGGETPPTDEVETSVVFVVLPCDTPALSLSLVLAGTVCE